MKKLSLLVACLLIGLVSCETETIETNDQLIEIPTNQIQERGGGVAEYPSNEMVIQYDPLLSEAERQQMRDEYGVISYKNCSCADPTLELWIFSTDPHNGGDGSIEEKVFGAKDDTGLEGVDFNPKIQHQGLKLQSLFGVDDLGIAFNKMVPSNDAVTIAVLDTGVDYNYFGFENSFLYNSQASQNNCADNGMEDYFGWDFVNEDNNPFDDYGHGTIVTSFIASSLEAANVNFQILPVKAFDKDGKGSYFDILCGFKYAVNNTDVDVVNMSFGWYRKDYELLNKFIVDSEGAAILTTSAGNDGVDNDFNLHYPSSYEANNILSVAALGSLPSSIGLASFSNYGLNSVDIAAAGEELPFYVSQTEYISVSGTSYANAYASAFCGKFYQPNLSPLQHMSVVLNNTTPHFNLGEIKYSSYIEN